jgi:hippurate hydrolase
MPVLNRIAGLSDEMREWRHWLHRNPELGFELPKTAAYVADRLREIGVDQIETGIAQTGIVAIIEGQGDGPTIGLRADMDALPIHETTGADHASETAGAMHACGHDGHTTMLLGAAKYLAETRRFKGRVALIFQPAEENGGGGKVMVDEGILDRYDISRVFGIHNEPNKPVGYFGTNPGPMLAACDEAFLTINGVGGHAASPEDATDPLPAAMSIVQAMNTIVSRNRPGIEPMIVSVTQFHCGGPATNVISDTAQIGASIRTFSDPARDMVERRVREIVAGHEAAFGVTIDLTYSRGYPVTRNNATEAAFAAEVAREISGDDLVDDAIDPTPASEDFSYMLNARPGAYVNLGQGPSAWLHQPDYDFNDDAAAFGASFFARLVERAQPLDD